MKSKVLQQILLRGKTYHQGSFAVALATSLYVLHQDDDSQKQNKCLKDKSTTLFDHVFNVNKTLNEPLLANNQWSNNNTNIRRRRTVQELMHDTATPRRHITDHYSVDWDTPLGEGAFGAVYMGQNMRTKEKVAVKKIGKKFTDNSTFLKEMEALLHIQKAGGHPHICGLREHFDYENDDHYYLVLDLVTGGEMFDHLCANGAYSELDASRLIREVASALAFLHGIGVVHADLKPENLMLSSSQCSDAVMKLVDFGCAQTEYDSDYIVTGASDNELVYTKIDDDDDDPKRKARRGTANTPAYCPPEVLAEEFESERIEPSFDMWALGVILYIMLTGVHPFDLYGNATDDEIIKKVVAGERPPLRDTKITAHLSKDAIDLIEQLLQWDPSKRLTANELLENPWVRGSAARTNKITDSDKKLSAYRAYRTKLSAKVFADMVSLSSKHNLTKKKSSVSTKMHVRDDDGVTKRTSLLERSFQKLDPSNKGYVTTRDIEHLTNATKQDGGDSSDASSEDHDSHLSLSGFSDLLSENMKNRYFPKGHVIYHEGEVGNVMYFLNSGVVNVYRKDGTIDAEVRQAGDCFGEGALLNEDRRRSASIKCVTPVHVIEVDREYFEKFMASEEGAKLDLREKNKARKQQRARTLLRLQQNMKPKVYKNGDYVFKTGDEGKEMYVIEEGQVQLISKGLKIITLEEGEMCGENSLILKRPRNVDAVCVANDQCKLLSLGAQDFDTLLDLNPSIKESVRDICNRRDFQKALCSKTKQPFPKSEDELRKAFQVADANQSTFLELPNIREVILSFDPNYTEDDIQRILNSLDIDESGKVSWEEFKRIFEMESDEENNDGA